MLAAFDEPAPELRLKPQVLTDIVAAVLTRAGYPEQRARLVADSLVDADVRGVTSHGATRTRIYVERVQKGLVDPTADPEVHGRGRAGRRVDAKNAPGQVAAKVAVDEAAAGARELGVCAVGVVNSNHCGALGYFLRMLASEGLIGMAATNGPPVMAYHGGRSRAVGTNPLGYAFPRRKGPPIVLDMATSNAARGKIIQAARIGHTSIPDGWALDTEGRPTTDPVAALAGATLPFAGPRGSGLAMGIDLLCGALLSGVTGRSVGGMYEQWDRSQRVGHFFMALDPGCWTDPTTYFGHAEQFVHDVLTLPPAVGHDRVMLPGERGERAAKKAYEQGVLVASAVVDDLAGLCRDLDVDAKLCEALAG